MASELLTPLLPRRLSWPDLRVRRVDDGGGSSPGRRRLSASARATSGVTYMTYKLEKWSGRLDSNQRPPAPKCTAMRRPAILCDASSRKSLILR
jgi:hypothetical protein